MLLIYNKWNIPMNIPFYQKSFFVTKHVHTTVIYIKPCYVLLVTKDRWLRTEML